MRLPGAVPVWSLVLPTLLALPQPTTAPAQGRGQCSSSEIAAVADSVAAAFDVHQFVFIGSTHGRKKSHDFALCLLSRPAFQQRATDVLVEWANPVHQPLVDRYLLRLEPVAMESLRRVWLDTDAPDLWGRTSLIPEFYSTVRAINTGLAPSRRLRILGGSEPIDWSRVSSSADLAVYPFKNNWAAHAIAEHFAPTPGRRLLVIYGDAHIHHAGGFLMAELAGRVDRAQRFVVGTIASLEEQDRERIARLRDSSRPFYRSTRDLPASVPAPEALFYVRERPLGDHVDAIVYLGPEPDRDLSRSVELTPQERSELDRRALLRGDSRQLMGLRLENRARWFQTHPNDLPARP